MKGVVRFSRSGKLVPRYIGPFPITERIGFLAYRLLLPAQFSVIHDVFHAPSFYENAFGISIFILEPGIVKEIEASPDLTLSEHLQAFSFLLYMVNFLFSNFVILR
jgi:hypothetical protein